MRQSDRIDPKEHTTEAILNVVKADLPAPWWRLPGGAWSKSCWWAAPPEGDHHDAA